MELSESFQPEISKKPQEHDYDTLQDDLCLMKRLNLKPKCESLKDLIDGLHSIFSEDRINVEEVQALMESYQSNPAEWLKYAKLDKYRYTRNLVDAGNGKFNLMILAWGEGHGSSIHDHSNSHCFMKILAGSLSEVRFKWPDCIEDVEDNRDDVSTMKPMEEISRNELKTNAVCYINDSLGLHRVENLSYADCAISLHLYCPPFETCRMFNERTGHSAKAKVSFWSVFGEKKKAKKNPVPEENN